MDFLKKEELIKKIENIVKNKILISVIFVLFILVILIFTFFSKNSGLGKIAEINEYNYSNCEEIYNAEIDSIFVKKTYKNYINLKKSECDNMYLNTKIFTEIEYDINSKIESPALYNNKFVNGSAEMGGIYDYDIELNDNIDLEKSSFELYFSNDNMELIENIISDFPKQIDGTLEDIVALIYIKNLYLNRKNKIINTEINNHEINDDLIKKIISYQNKDGGFKKYSLDLYSNADTTSYVSKTLKKLKTLGVSIDESIIKSSLKYLNNEANKEKESNLSYLKNKYLNTNIGYQKDNYLKGKSTTMEKTNLLGLLIDTDHEDKEFVDKVLNDLLLVNINDYFLSNKQKSYLFEAFIKYTNKYSSNFNSSKYGFMLGTLRNQEKVFWLGKSASSIKKYNYNADKIIYDNEGSFRLATILGSRINFGLLFKQYYIDISKNNISNDDLHIKRNFYELTSERDLKKCFLSNNFDCNQSFKLKEDNIFGENKIYKISINIKNKDELSELVIEDFIPDNFIFLDLDNKYSTNKDYKFINYNNNNIKVIYDNNSEITLEYFVKPKNKGVFDYYPAIVYLENNSEIISNTDIYKVESK